jgi:hypothetical protein
LTSACRQRGAPDNAHHKSTSFNILNKVQFSDPPLSLRERKKSVPPLVRAQLRQTRSAEQARVRSFEAVLRKQMWDHPVVGLLAQAWVAFYGFACFG